MHTIWQALKINNAPMHAHTHTHTGSRSGTRNITIRASKLLETKGKRQTHPDVLIMESYNEDQETPSGQADGTVDD